MTRTSITADPTPRCTPTSGANAAATTAWTSVTIAPAQVLPATMAAREIGATSTARSIPNSRSQTTVIPWNIPPKRIVIAIAPA